MNYQMWGKVFNAQAWIIGPLSDYVSALFAGAFASYQCKACHYGSYSSALGDAFCLTIQGNALSPRIINPV